MMNGLHEKVLRSVRLIPGIVNDVKSGHNCFIDNAVDLCNEGERRVQLDRVKSTPA